MFANPKAVIMDINISLENIRLCVVAYKSEISQYSAWIQPKIRLNYYLNIPKFDRNIRNSKQIIKFY